MKINIKLYQGNVLSSLSKIADNSVDCVVTSPPYYALRNYNAVGSYADTNKEVVEQKMAEDIAWYKEHYPAYTYNLSPVIQMETINEETGEKALLWHGSVRFDTGTIWDALPGCAHEWIAHKQPARDGVAKSSIVSANMEFEANNRGHTTITNFCSKCDAWRGDLGLEPDFNMYLNHLLQVTSELYRILKPTGTLWWNIADSYAGNMGKRSGWSYNKNTNNEQAQNDGTAISLKAKYSMPDKCKMQIPERLSTRMVDEQHWILRNDIIWEKPNHMPSSVKDRVSPGYEHIYFFVKSKHYFFNLDAIREEYAAVSIDRAKYAVQSFQAYGNLKNATGYTTDKLALLNEGGKNPGDIWRITNKPFKDAHFATFPPDLPERCMKAGASNEVCIKCGKPKMIKLVFDKYVDSRNGETVEEPLRHTEAPKYENHMNLSQTSSLRTGVKKTYRQEYVPTCACGAAFIPPTILDPFAGSGTTLMAAKEAWYSSIGIELNPSYVEMIKTRLYWGAGFGNIEWSYEADGKVSP